MIGFIIVFFVGLCLIAGLCHYHNIINKSNRTKCKNMLKRLERFKNSINNLKKN